MHPPHELFLRIHRDNGVDDTDIEDKAYIDALDWLRDGDLEKGDQLFWTINEDYRLQVTFLRYDSTGLCGITDDVDDVSKIAWVERTSLRKVSWLELLALCAGEDDGASQEEGS